MVGPAGFNGLLVGVLLWGLFSVIWGVGGGGGGGKSQAKALRAAIEL